jgi:hypothetical protein
VPVSIMLPPKVNRSTIAARVGGRGWQQRLDALPQRIGQELVGQSGHEPGIIASPGPAHRLHPRFRNVLLACVLTLVRAVRLCDRGGW